MSICKACNGTGKRSNNYEDIFRACEICGGTGKVVQTNEEFLRSASANDMARCIATKLLELARHEYGIYDVVDYATVFEWLKQPHNE